MLDKAYDAKQFEDGIYRKWEESGVFKADVKSKKDPFTISMPPPNATGVLHLGHAVMLALEFFLFALYLWFLNTKRVQWIHEFKIRIFHK